MERLQLNKGFTLVELLVVIAIITILASIVVPNVTDWIGRARVAKAVSEINSAELALTKMLSDAQKSSFRDLLRNPYPDEHEGRYIGSMFNSGTQNFDLPCNLITAEALYTEIFYNLLRRGKDAIETSIGIYLKPAVARKLGNNYMDLGKDPWGNLYRFFPGPLGNLRGVPGAQTVENVMGAKDTYLHYPMPFRVYFADLSVPGGPQRDMNTLDIIPEHPIGYPAPESLPIYIYSPGADLQSGQAILTGGSSQDAAAMNQGQSAYLADLPSPEHMGGGDDINNWDNAASWDEFY